MQQEKQNLEPNLRNLITLESIRVSGNKVPYPVCDDWGYLEEEIQWLIKDGLLSIVSDFCEISQDGKKMLLLFDMERREVLKQFEPYREVRIGKTTLDARLPLSAYMMIKEKADNKHELLFSMAAMIVWRSFFDYVRTLAQDESSLWQKDLFPAFMENAGRYARLDIWRVMGQTRTEAINTCELLLNPNPSKNLIQLTRNEH